MTLNVFSMFDGVGGFIHGLDNANEQAHSQLFNVTIQINLNQAESPKTL
ncbi:hypothetical protein [Bacillus toyonensis]|nr:hypothetical protein [Bacillus toyonensis]